MGFDVHMRHTVVLVHHGLQTGSFSFVTDCLALRRETFSICVMASTSELIGTSAC
jgi:hypothetical protein